MAKAEISEIPVDRRDESDRRKKNVPVAAERRKVQRRRQIDPTTCERDYTNDEIEFMQALDEYKRNNGRMFPTCSEILEVIRGLGYRREEPNEAATPEETSGESTIADDQLAEAELLDADAAAAEDHQ